MTVKPAVIQASFVGYAHKDQPRNLRKASIYGWLISIGQLLPLRCSQRHRYDAWPDQLGHDTTVAHGPDKSDYFIPIHMSLTAVIKTHNHTTIMITSMLYDLSNAEKLTHLAQMNADWQSESCMKYSHFEQANKKHKLKWLKSYKRLFNEHNLGIFFGMLVANYFWIALTGSIFKPLRPRWSGGFVPLRYQYSCLHMRICYLYRLMDIFIMFLSYELHDIQCPNTGLIAHQSEHNDPSAR